MLPHCHASAAAGVSPLDLYEGVPSLSGTQKEAESGRRRARAAARAWATDKCWKNREAKKGVADGCVQILSGSTPREGLQRASAKWGVLRLAQGTSGAP